MFRTMSRTDTTDRRLVVLLLAACLAAVGVTVSTGSPARADASTLHQLLNQSRAAAGKPGLVRDSRLDRVAQDWTARMVASGTMSHNPSYASQIPSGWTRAGENVASRYGSDSQLHQAWMASPGHRANILGSYTSVGIGFVRAADGIWATQVFATYPGTVATAPTAPVVVSIAPAPSSPDVTAGPPPATSLATFATTTRTAQLRRISTAAMTTSQDLGGGVRGEPSVVNRGGRLEVYARGTNDRMYVRTGSGSSWSPWTQVPAGVVTSAPSAVVRSGAVEVYFRDGAGRVAVVRSPSAGSWKTVGVVGGAVLAGTGPAATVTSGGAQVSVVGTNRSVYVTRPGTGTWTSLGGAALGVAAVQDASGLHVVVRGTDNRAYAQRYGAGRWVALLGATATAPRAGVDSSGRPTAVVLGTDGALYASSLTRPAGWTRVS